MTYTKSAQMKGIFADQVLKLFTDVCGGDPKELSEILHAKYTVDDFAYHDDWYFYGILKYLQETVMPHKIAVHQAGMDLSREPWFKNYLKEQERELFLENLWVHDLSKLSANEVFGYAMYNRETGHGKEGFERAWHHHKMNNPHHPEYWFNPSRSGELEPIPMPELYVMEMIADWIGAGKTYGSSLGEWLPKNINKFKFGASKGIVMNILQDIGIKTFIHEGNILQTTQ